MGYMENFLPYEQKKLGFDVEIITSDRIPSYKGYKQHVGKMLGSRIIGTGTFEENGIKIHRLPIFFEINDGGQILLIGLKKKLKQLKPDIIQAHGPYSLSTIQATLYCKKLCGGIYIDDHTHKNNFKLTSLSKITYIELVKVFYYIYGKRVLYWMPVTYSAKRILQSLLKIPDEKIGLLHLGADTNRFRKSIELRKTGREECYINDNCLLIISTGKFEESKDVHILIKAFGKAAEQYPSIRLLLIGNGPEEYMEKLKSLVNSIGLDNKIFFKNFAPNSELPKLYNAADIGVWSGDHSITVIEATATGLPVIVPNEDLAYKVLFMHNAAIGFERGNVDSLSIAILKLIENKELRSKLSVNSVVLASETLSWEKIAEKSILLYFQKEDAIYSHK